MDIILRLKKVRRFTRSALLPVLWFFAAEIGAQATGLQYVRRRRLRRRG